MTDSDLSSADTASLTEPEGVGRLSQLPNGNFRVTFVREYDRPLEDLWEAISTPDGLDTWYPTKVRHEGVVGSKITETFESEDGTPPEDVPPSTLTAYEPPHVIEMRVNGPAESEYPGMRGLQTIRMEASVDTDPEGAPNGGSRLTFTHDLEYEDSALNVLPGWHWCLEFLALHMGEEGDGSKEFHDRLVEWYETAFS